MTGKSDMTSYLFINQNCKSKGNSRVCDLPTREMYGKKQHIRHIKTLHKLWYFCIILIIHMRRHGTLESKYSKNMEQFGKDSVQQYGVRANWVYQRTMHPEQYGVRRVYVICKKKSRL